MAAKFIKTASVLFLAAFSFGCQFAQSQSNIPNLEMQTSGGNSDVSSDSNSRDRASETYQGFVEEFKKSDSSDFSEKDLNRIFQDYSSFIMPALDVNALANSIAGRETHQNPLEKFKDEPFYRPKIEKLIDSKNLNQRVLAYVVVGSASKDWSMKRTAAMGLGVLKDASSVDLIVAAMKEEPPTDSNSASYLLALSKIQGDQAKKVIESFAGSKDDRIKAMVGELLQKW